jgi:competence protein ComEC
MMPAGIIGLLAMAVRLRRAVLASDGDRHRLDDRGDAMGLPGAVGRVAAFGTRPLIAASLGLVLVGLLRSPLRWSDAVVLVATIWAAATPQPDVLISGDGRNVAVRGKDGQLRLMRISKDAFLFKEWLAADADARGLAESFALAGCVLRRFRLRGAKSRRLAGRAQPTRWSMIACAPHSS